MMIEMDDPQHLLRRKLVNAGFTRKRVKDLETSIDSLCDVLIDAVCERGSATSSGTSPRHCRWR
jgi:cholest-4-en-3-one 26-monooxygenase